MASHGWVENSVVAGNDNWGGVFGFHCSNCSLLLYDPQTKQKSDDDDVVASAAPKPNFTDSFTGTRSDYCSGGFPGCGAAPLDPAGLSRSDNGESGPVARKSDDEADDARPLGEVVDLGSRKHLFADRFLLSSVVNLTVQLVPLVPAQTRLIVAEEPWEVGPGCYLEAGGNIIHERDRLRLWYSIRNCSDTVDTMHAHGKDCHAYAESTDSGRSWVKPHLNTVRFRGSTENNCVIIREQQIGGSGGSLEPPGPLS